MTAENDPLAGANTLVEARCKSKSLWRQGNEIPQFQFLIKLLTEQVNQIEEDKIALRYMTNPHRRHAHQDLDLLG
jgi:hypothetical protein